MVKSNYLVRMWVMNSLQVVMATGVVHGFKDKTQMKASWNAYGAIS